MRSSRALPLPVVLAGLFAATGLSLIAAVALRSGIRGPAIATLSLAKVMLIVLGFMRLQRESPKLAGALIAYATVICVLAGVRIALAGPS
ncbi:hypothetical protein ASE61_08995 [Bosea sp. Root670]|uniref:hypothetical protein n=1 Tax=Bosea sp. Root670 TaxID=1736583 RepID=UPI000715555D|nr:hypothetical protein [Bosea sp. Root670]KRE03762.1 hypothetical protein ASE61_08995 [Bosea sp. Root670]